MLRNKMRIRFNDKNLSYDIQMYLTEHNETAKQLFRADRLNVLKEIMDKKFSYPLTYDTVLHAINHIIIKDKKLGNFEDSYLRKDLDILFIYNDKKSSLRLDFLSFTMVSYHQ